MESGTKQPGWPLSAGRRFASESEATGTWNAEASELLKLSMMRRGWGYRELSEALRAQGINSSAAAINRRINRANFTAGFLLACLRALDYEIELRERES